MAGRLHLPLPLVINRCGKLCRYWIFDVLCSSYEHLVIPELDPALEYRPASVVLTPVESDVIDLLLITRLLRIMLDMLAGDSIRGQFTGNLLPVAFCLYIEVEAVFGINCCLSHNCEFEFYRLSLSPEGDEIFPFSPSPGVQAFFLFPSSAEASPSGFSIFPVLLRVKDQELMTG